MKENNIDDVYSKNFIEENMKQRSEFYKDGGQNFKYREEKMIENFKKQYEKIGNKSIVGFYGMAHLNDIKPEPYRSYTDNLIMIDALKKLYRDIVIVTDLTNMDLSVRDEEVEILGKNYNAKYYEWINGNNEEGEKICQIWEVENVYYDFKNFETIGEYYSNTIGILNAKENTVYKFRYRENGVDYSKIFLTGRKDEQKGVIVIRELKID